MEDTQGNDKRLAAVEEDVKVLKVQHETMEKRQDKQGIEIDTLIKSDIEQIGEMKLVRKDLEFISRTTQKTEDKLDKLSVQPLNRYRKIGEYIAIAIVGAVVAIVLQRIGLQ